jgi:hypothetical protein
MIRVLLATGIAAVGLGVVLAPVASAQRPYKNCTAAHADGRYNIPEGDDAYWSGGDRDGDGYACE